MEITTYNAKDVSVTVDNVFITGFAEGTFVEAAKDEDNFDTSVGAQGDVAISEVNNSLGTITITLQQNSPSIPFLDRLAKSRRVVPAYVISNSGGVKEITGGSRARVVKPADKTYADTAEDREYELRVFDYNG